MNKLAEYRFAVMVPVDWPIDQRQKFMEDLLPMIEEAVARNCTIACEAYGAVARFEEMGGDGGTWGEV